MTYVIRLTGDQYAEVLASLDEIVDSHDKDMMRQWAARARQILEQETEHPAQQAVERAEAMGDDYDALAF